MFSVSEQVLFGFVLFPDGLIQDQLQHIHCPNQNTEGWKTKTIQPNNQRTTRVSKYTAFQYPDNHNLTSKRKYGTIFVPNPDFCFWGRWERENLSAVQTLL